MHKLALIASTTFALLAAACSPADSIPQANAQAQASTVALYPELAPGAGDGHVHEYH